MSLLVEQWRRQQWSTFWRGTGRDSRRHCTKQRSAAGADAQPSGRSQRGRQLCRPQRPRGMHNSLDCHVAMPFKELIHAGYQASPFANGFCFLSMCAMCEGCHAQTRVRHWACHWASALGSWLGSFLDSHHSFSGCHDCNAVSGAYPAG